MESLPQEIVRSLLLYLLDVSGRNEVFSFRSVSKHFFSLIQSDNSLWREVVMSYHHRLLAQTSLAASFNAFFSLALHLFSVGMRHEIERPSLSEAATPFSWLSRQRLDFTMAQAGGRLGASKGVETIRSSIQEVTLDWGKRYGSRLDSAVGGDLLLFFGIPIYRLESINDSFYFWFESIPALDGTPLALRLGSLLRSGAALLSTSLIEDDVLIKSIVSLAPASDRWFGIVDDEYIEVELGNKNPTFSAFHTVIVPTRVSSNGEDPNFYQNCELHRLRPAADASYTPRHGMAYFKYTMPLYPLKMSRHGANQVTNILLPLQDPEKVPLNEERVLFYEQMLRRGVIPTVAALCLQCQSKRRQQSDLSSRVNVQYLIVSLIIDGHHKIEAAHRLNLPIRLLMVYPDDSYYSWLLGCLNNPTPSLPLSRREQQTFLGESAPALFFDNLAGRSIGEKDVLDAVCPAEEREFVEKISFRPSQMQNGGTIFFKTNYARMRALERAQGAEVGTFGRISLQLATPEEGNEEPPGW